MGQSISVSGMACTGCEESIEAELATVDGITGVSADHESGTVTIEGKADRADIHAAITAAGYEVEA